MKNKINYEKICISIPIEQYRDLESTRNGLPMSWHISSLLAGPLKEKMARGKT